MNINPKEDGITHLNVYSKGATSLGRFLSNFTRCPIVTEDGPFESIEGYWYWLGCEDVPGKEDLRSLSGFTAKKRGRELRAKDWQQSQEFKGKICRAITLKLRTSDYWLGQLVCNELPLKHYYVYGGDKVVEPSDGQWILDHIQKIANENIK